MRVIDKNEGRKIEYEVSGNKITFDDDLTINLSKREEDWDVHIDVCYDSDKMLVIGAAAGRSYVAEIDIPRRAYTYEMPEEPDDQERGPIATPVPFSMDNVTLTLWAVM